VRLRLRHRDREITPIEWTQIDAIFDLYAHWREQARAVQDAYEDWRAAASNARSAAFAAYTAALNGEEHVSRLYADLARREAVQ
jgi:hypothetical protein